MRNRLYIRLFIGTVLAIVVSALESCGNSQGNSTPPQPPSLVSLVLSPAQTSVIAGKSQQYSLVGKYSDGTMKDVTSSARWSTSDSTIATVNSNGLAITLRQGLVTISAADSSLTMSAQLTAGPLMVELSVTASDPGHVLSYQWQSTDGSIQNVNSATTEWNLPDGPGLHFAYVLVSNGMGGYTERRIAINTDANGTPPDSETSPVNLTPPAAPVRVGDYYRSFIWSAGYLSTPYFDPQGHTVHARDIPVILVNGSIGGTPNATYPSTGPVKTSATGEFVVPSVPEGNGYWTSCSYSFGAPTADCSGTFRMPSHAFTNYLSGGLQNGSSPTIIAGTLALQDGTPCGMQNEFFGLQVFASVTLLDNSGAAIGQAGRTDYIGDYSVPFSPNAAFVKLQCENAAAIIIAIGSRLNSTGTTDLGLSTVQGVGRPTIANISATISGTSTGTFLPPPSGIPSDVIIRDDAFLAFKGLDSRISSCRYYLAVGAVASCDANGNFSGAISFDDWQRGVKIGKYSSGATEFTATYVNKVDLNLTREHHSISYGPTQTAAYVCNHLGPPTPTQIDVDTAVDNAVQAKNLVACVAMDYSSSPQVNGGVAFTRFLIFGPSGQLLPSVNLDGRREKFVPGTCVVCHGGDHYAGKFPEDGSGFADIGAHFLPYDAGNFEFSDKPGLTEVDQEEAIYNLNQNVLSAGPTIAEQELIAGWYLNGKVLDKNYVPVSWQSQSTDAIKFYQKVNARSCRTCHVAMVEVWNFDHYQNAFGYASIQSALCAPSIPEPTQDYSMPNSLVTFNNFWQSVGALDDQPSIAGKFFGGASCQLRNVGGSFYQPLSVGVTKNGGTLLSRRGVAKKEPGVPRFLDRTPLYVHP